MKKIKVIYQLVFSILILFTARTGLSKITTVSFTDYTVTGQGILPNNRYNQSPYDGYIIIAGLNIASDSGQRLTGVTITNNPVSTYGGLDIDRSAILDRSGNVLASISGTGTIPCNIAIPADDEGGNEGDDFFIAIRTTDDSLMDSSSNFKIDRVSWTPVEEGDADSPSLTTNTIICELIVVDLLPIEFTNVSHHNSTSTPEYPSYFQWQPGEQIRPDYLNNTYNLSPYPLEHPIPQVIPFETPTAVLAIGCSQRNVTPSGTASPKIQDPPEYLTSITLTITDTGKSNFDPTKSFRTEYVDDKYNGIQLWRDTNQDGKWDPDVDAIIDINLSIFPSGDNEWKAIITPANEEPIENLYDGIYDYFIVIVIRSNPEDSSYRPVIGRDFKIWINPGDIIFGPVSYPVKYAGINIGQVKTIYSNLYLEDVSQRRVDPERTESEVDLTDNVIPVFGINIASGPSDIENAPDLGSFDSFDGTRIRDIKIEILAFENFDPRTDLAPLSSSGDEKAGITLWRDNKERGNIGSFDSSDTFVPTNSSGWVYAGFVNDPEYGPCHLYYCIISTVAMAEDQGEIYPDDWHSSYNGSVFPANYYGDDFFVCIRTKENMSYGAKFRVRIPEDGGLKLTYPIEDYYNSLSCSTEEIYGNVFVKITSLTDPGNPGLVPNSPPTPVFKVELNDNNSGKSPKLEQMAVEFYDRGNFSLDDLASFDPIYPVFNPSTGWYDVTYFNIDALKQCGVVIYQDDGDGNFYEDLDTPVLIRRYRILSYPGTPSTYQFEFLNPVAIPATLFVVIRTSSTFSSGDSFDCGIVGWGIDTSDWETWGSRAIGIADINEVKSNVYVRAQSGIFNPIYSESFLANTLSEFNGIWIYWNNSTYIPPESFLYYEILRTDTTTGITESIATIHNYNTNFYFNSVDGPFPPEEGVQYQYIVRMHYLQGGEEKTIDSNVSPDPSDPYYFHKGRLLGWPDNMSPDDVRAVGGINSITIYWRDRSYDPDHPDKRATQFLIRRVNLTDNTYFEMPVAAHFEPDWVDYTYVDSDIETAVDYRYEIYAQRIAENGGIVESKPGISEPVQAYGQQPDEGGGGGGCFIATASYGSYQEKHVWILRQFRDKYLLTNKSGKAFVRWYYRHSPKYASIIAKNGFLRFLTRIFLTPLYLFAYIFLKTRYLLLLFLFLLNTGIIFSIRLYSKVK
ncbi:hypothetical protein J7K25_03420 [bacterium]|nr:hypothetical protein [bacterium]